LVAEGYQALGRNQEALDLLGEMESAARHDGRFGLLIRVYLLEALAQQGQHAAGLPPATRGTGRAQEVASAARRSLARALELAEPEGYVLVFLEALPALAPLLAFIKDDAGGNERVRGYAARLLAASAPSANTSPGQGNIPLGDAGRRNLALGQYDQEPAPAEPLSDRELEILRLIGEGYTNQEIAGSLVITLHTVKKHSSNIFGKLGVSSRTQAVARARRLGLIE
jgi:LuxR family transcriptional regulator, maltose regulon positive regulatory protein